MNLNAISKGAMSYFESEHVQSDGLSAFSKQYPSQATAAHLGTSANSNTVGLKSAITANQIAEDSCWGKLNFTVNSPIYYYYSYQGIGISTSGSKTKYAKSYFQATATASLSSATDSMFAVSGNSRGKLTAIMDGSESATVRAALVPPLTLNDAVAADFGVN